MSKKWNSKALIRYYITTRKEEYELFTYFNLLLSDPDTMKNLSQHRRCVIYYIKPFLKRLFTNVTVQF